MINFAFRFFLLLFVLIGYENVGCIAKTGTKLYLVKVEEKKSTNINKRKRFRDYKSEDADQDYFFKQSKTKDDSFLDGMRKELGIVKGFFRSSSNTRGNSRCNEIENKLEF